MDPHISSQGVFETPIAAVRRRLCELLARKPPPARKVRTRKPPKPKPNHLTMETNRIIAAADRREHRGTPERAQARCETWVRWKLAATGKSIPATAIFAISDDGQHALFTEHVCTPAKTKAGVDVWTQVTHATIGLPWYVQPVQDVDAASKTRDRERRKAA